MRILLVEDSQVQQRAFENAVKVLKNKSDITVEYDIVEDVRGALKAIDGSYDGAIIDLRLGNDEDGGNEIVRQLGDPFTRIPIIFVTGYVKSVDDRPSVIRKRGRDDGSYESDLQLFKGIYDTGLTRIMGGRGDIEKHLTEVFHRNLLPQIETWVSYGKEDPERTEMALLRYALNHLFQLLEEGGEGCFPEEVYLHPPLLEGITTGSIVKEKANDQPFVVLSPACDLVLRGQNGKSNTDRILLVEIESVDDAFGGSRSKNRVESLVKNRRQYFHWLPPAYSFEGGVINFRKLNTIIKDEFDANFEKPSIQISPFFVKDIVARFSSFYARQGQPDIDSTHFENQWTAPQDETQ